MYNVYSSRCVSPIDDSSEIPDVLPRTCCCSGCYTNQRTIIELMVVVASLCSESLHTDVVPNVIDQNVFEQKVKSVIKLKYACLTRIFYQKCTIFLDQI